jgi:hypothetical protein
LIDFLSTKKAIQGVYLCPMADVHSKEMRSYNMSRIKGKNTKPEMLVRKRSERLPSAV